MYGVSARPGNNVKTTKIVEAISPKLTKAILGAMECYSAN